METKPCPTCGQQLDDTSGLCPQCNATPSLTEKVDGIGAPVKVYGGKLHEFYFTRRSRLALAIAMAASVVTVWAGYRAVISTGEVALPFSILATIAATVMVVALWAFYRAIPTVFTVGLHESGIRCKLGDRQWTFQYGDEVAILTNYPLSGNLSETEPGHEPETGSAIEGPCSLSINSASEGCFRLSKEMFAGITQPHELCMTLQENFLGSRFDRDWKSLNDGREVWNEPLVIGRHSIRHGSHRIPLYDIDRVMIDSERNRLAILQKNQTQPWQTVDLNSLVNGFVVVKLLRQLDVVVQSGTVDEVKRRWTERITDRMFGKTTDNPTSETDTYRLSLAQKIIVVCFGVLGAAYGQWTWMSSSDEFQHIENLWIEHHELWSEHSEIEKEIFNRAKRADAKALEKIAEPPLPVKPTPPEHPPAPMKLPAESPLGRSEAEPQPPQQPAFTQEELDAAGAASVFGNQPPAGGQRQPLDGAAASVFFGPPPTAQQQARTYEYKWRIEVILRKMEVIRHKLAQDGIIYPIEDTVVVIPANPMPDEYLRGLPVRYASTNGREGETRAFYISRSASWDRTIKRMVLIGLIFGLVAAFIVYPLGAELGVSVDDHTESAAYKSKDSPGDQADDTSSTKTSVARTVMDMKCTWIIVTIILSAIISIDLPNSQIGRLLVDLSALSVERSNSLVGLLILNLFVIALLGSVLEPRFGSRNLVLLAVIGIVATPIAAASISWTLIGALCILPLRNSRNFLSWEENVTILAVVAVILSFGYQLASSPEWIEIGGQFACLLAGAFFGWKFFVSADSTSDGSAKC